MPAAAPAGAAAMLAWPGRAMSREYLGSCARRSSYRCGKKKLKVRTTPLMQHTSNVLTEGGKGKKKKKTPSHLI